MKTIILASLICLSIACSKSHSNPPINIGGQTIATNCGGQLQTGTFPINNGTYWVRTGSVFQTSTNTWLNTMTGIAGMTFYDGAFDAGFVQQTEAQYYFYFDSTLKVTSGLWAGMPSYYYDGNQTITFGNGTPYKITGSSVCNVGITLTLTNDHQQVVLFEMTPNEVQEWHQQQQARRAAKGIILQ